MCTNLLQKPAFRVIKLALRVHSCWRILRVNCYSRRSRPIEGGHMDHVWNRARAREGNMAWGWKGQEGPNHRGLLDHVPGFVLFLRGKGEPLGRWKGGVILSNSPDKILWLQHWQWIGGWLKRMWWDQFKGSRWQERVVVWTREMAVKVDRSRKT